MGWYELLDEVKVKIEAQQAATKFPTCHIYVEEGPSDFEALKRMRKRSPAMFLSIAGVEDTDVANVSRGDMTVTADIYHEGKADRNRLAAAICEQLHVFLRHPADYEIPSGGVSRPKAIRFVNLSYASGADQQKLAYWRAQWTYAATCSEALNPDALVALTKIHVDTSGEFFGGGATHDTDDDHDTEVTFP